MVLQTQRLESSSNSTFSMICARYILWANWNRYGLWMLIQKGYYDPVGLRSARPVSHRCVKQRAMNHKVTNIDVVTCPLIDIDSVLRLVQVNLCARTRRSILRGMIYVNAWPLCSPVTSLMARLVATL